MQGHVESIAEVFRSLHVFVRLPLVNQDLLFGRWAKYEHVGDVEFDYFVNGVRRGFADLELIRENYAYVPDVRGVSSFAYESSTAASPAPQRASMRWR